MNIGKNWVQNVVYMSNEMNWRLFLLRFLIRICLFFVFLFKFFGIVSFVTTTLDQLQFQSEVRLSQINLVIPIRLIFKLYAVFIEWGSKINFLFVGRQDIVNYWDFPSYISRNSHKKLVPKIARHDQWDLFVKISLRDRLICFAHFVGMTLLACLMPMGVLRSLLPLRNCFLKVCLPTLFAAVLKFFLPLTTCAVFGTENSHKSTPSRFAAGTTFLR